MQNGKRNRSRDLSPALAKRPRVNAPAMFPTHAADVKLQHAIRELVCNAFDDNLMNNWPMACEDVYDATSDRVFLSMQNCNSTSVRIIIHNKCTAIHEDDFCLQRSQKGVDCASGTFPVGHRGSGLIISLLSLLNEPGCHVLFETCTHVFVVAPFTSPSAGLHAEFCKKLLEDYQDINTETAFSSQGDSQSVVKSVDLDELDQGTADGSLQITTFSRSNSDIPLRGTRVQIVFTSVSSETCQRVHTAFWEARNSILYTYVPARLQRFQVASLFRMRDQQAIPLLDVYLNLPGLPEGISPLGLDPAEVGVLPCPRYVFINGAAYALRKAGPDEDFAAPNSRRALLSERDQSPTRLPMLLYNFHVPHSSNCLGPHDKLDLLMYNLHEGMAQHRLDVDSQPVINALEYVFKHFPIHNVSQLSIVKQLPLFVRSKLLPSWIPELFDGQVADRYRQLFSNAEIQEILGKCCNMSKDHLYADPIDCEAQFAASLEVFKQQFPWKMPCDVQRNFSTCQLVCIPGYAMLDLVAKWGESYAHWLSASHRGYVEHLRAFDMFKNFIVRLHRDGLSAAKDMRTMFDAHVRMINQREKEAALLLEEQRKILADNESTGGDDDADGGSHALEVAAVELDIAEIRQRIEVADGHANSTAASKSELLVYYGTREKWEVESSFSVPVGAETWLHIKLQPLRGYNAPISNECVASDALPWCLYSALCIQGTRKTAFFRGLSRSNKSRPVVLKQALWLGQLCMILQAHGYGDVDIDECAKCTTMHAFTDTSRVILMPSSAVETAGRNKHALPSYIIQEVLQMVVANLLPSPVVGRGCLDVQGPQFHSLIRCSVQLIMAEQNAQSSAYALTVIDRDRPISEAQMIHIVCLIDKWGRRTGGVGVFNVRFCQALAKIPNVFVTCIAANVMEAVEQLPDYPRLRVLPAPSGFPPFAEASSGAEAIMRLSLVDAGHFDRFRSPSTAFPRLVDVVVGHDRFSGDAAIAVAARMAARSVYIAHTDPRAISMYKSSYGPSGYDGEPKRKEMESSMKRSDFVVFAGRLMYDFPTSSAKDRCAAFQPGWFPVPATSAQTSWKNNEKDLSAVIIAGRVSDAVKGSEVFAKVVSMLKSSVPNARAVYLGSEYLSPAGADRKPHGAHYDMHIPFVDDDAELHQWYVESLCLLLPSWVDSFGLVVAEAMGAGVPFFVTPNSGVGVYLSSLANKIDLQRKQFPPTADGATMNESDWALLKQFLDHVVVTVEENTSPEDHARAWVTAIQQLISNGRSIVHDQLQLLKRVWPTWDQSVARLFDTHLRTLIPNR